MQNDRSQLARPWMPSVDRMEGLDEISAWVGTFKERLRLAREHEREHLTAALDELNRDHPRRRAELA